MVTRICQCAQLGRSLMWRRNSHLSKLVNLRRRSGHADHEFLQRTALSMPQQENHLVALWVEVHAPSGLAARGKRSILGLRRHPPKAFVHVAGAKPSAARLPAGCDTGLGGAGSCALYQFDATLPIGKWLPCSHHMQEDVDLLELGQDEQPMIDRRDVVDTKSADRFVDCRGLSAQCVSTSPAHGTSLHVVRDIRETPQPARGNTRASAASSSGRTITRTRMSGLAEQRQMSVIWGRTGRIVRRLSPRCPGCIPPGWRSSGIRTGPACRACCNPTDLTLKDTISSVASESEELFSSAHQRYADVACCRHHNIQSEKGLSYDQQIQ